MTRPNLNNVPAVYQGYVTLVKDADVIEAMKASNERMLQLIRSIPDEKGLFRYAPEKWSIKEVLCHIIDAERIFTYRALRFARNDGTPLPGFDENEYAPQAGADARTLEAIAEESAHLRQATIDLFKSFTTDMLTRTGAANNTSISVLHLGYIIAGHESHHYNILQERYLQK
jgi:uncharacterized damage-inducible protein DinB